jgi:uncharacterized protein YhhL (DUF1145 family)
MNIGKKLTIILWFSLSINFYLTSSAISTMISFNGFDSLNTLALILITVHLMECCIFYKRISNAEKNPVKGLVLTLVFGLLYIKDLKTEK